jgi:hypothetical protein
MLLQDCTRLLCNQLRALPSDKRSIEELRQAGEYVDLAELWLQIDTFLAELDYSEHTEVNARRIHDALMLLLCFREHPITRPTCIRLLLVPGVLLPCNLCNVPGCMGNSWSGRTAVIRHYKTSGTYGSHSITVLEGSKTEQVLKEYICWGRTPAATRSSSRATASPSSATGASTSTCLACCSLCQEPSSAGPRHVLLVLLHLPGEVPTLTLHPPTAATHHRQRLGATGHC